MAGGLGAGTVEAGGPGSCAGGSPNDPVMGGGWAGP